MKEGGRVVDDERVQRYVSMTKERLSRALEEQAPRAVIDKARRYLSDAEFYLAKGDTATALASVSYSHGLLDGVLPASEPGRDRLERIFLGKVFIGRLSGTSAIAAIGGSMGLDTGSLQNLAQSLLAGGLLVGDENSLRLSPQGRARIRVGLAAGVFDLIHPGHLAFLRWAKRHVDVLIVIIARDPNSKRRKGRAPIQPESDRLAVVSQLKPVDYAWLGDPEDIFSPVERIRPDVIFLGKDQEPDGRRIRAELAKRDLGPRIVRSRVWDAGTLSKTTKIVERIIRSS